MPIQKITATNRTGEKFGNAVDLNKDIIVLGAVENWAGPSQVYSETGAAYAFQKDKTTGEWKEMAKFMKSNPEEGDHFGHDIAIHNSYLVIAARQTNIYRGSIHLFNLTTSGTWVALQSSESSKAEVGDRFGTSVDIWNGNMIIGATGEDHDLEEKNKLESSGAGYILEPGVPLAITPPDKSFIQLYPNPSTGEFRLKSNKPLQNASIQILDMKGQIVYEQTLENKDPLRLNLTSGVYNLSLYNDAMFLGVSRLIILNN